MHNAETDQTAFFQERIRAAQRDKSPVYIHGGGSKLSLMGRACNAPPLSAAQHRGILKYEPKELLITARAGTSIAELRHAAGEYDQVLPFEPAELNAVATIGGCLASGVSGPSRPWKGSIRDAVLGVRLIDGHGKLLRFGGEVVKNVAGYDVSRLQAGALGSLGLITEVSFRVLPRAESSHYLSSPCNVQDAIPRLRELAAKSWPISGLSWFKDSIFLRLESDAESCRAVAQGLSSFSETDGSFWTALREQNLQACRSGVCADIAPATPLSHPQHITLIDWAGSRRHYAQTLSWQDAHTLATAGKGHAMRLGKGKDDIDWISEPPGALKALQKRIKHAVDPEGIFNPQRLYSWL